MPLSNRQETKEIKPFMNRKIGCSCLDMLSLNVCKLYATRQKEKGLQLLETLYR